MTTFVKQPLRILLSTLLFIKVLTLTNGDKFNWNCCEEKTNKTMPRDLHMETIVQIFMSQVEIY